MSISGRIDQDSLSGRPIASTGLDGLPYPFPRQFFCLYTRETAVYTEGTAAGVGGARTSFVIVAAGREPDSIASFDRLLQEPLELTPFRVDLDHGLQIRIVPLEVRIPPAHVRY